MRSILIFCVLMIGCATAQQAEIPTVQVKVESITYFNCNGGGHSMIVIYNEKRHLLLNCGGRNIDIWRKSNVGDTIEVNQDDLY